MAIANLTSKNMTEEEVDLAETFGAFAVQGVMQSTAKGTFMISQIPFLNLISGEDVAFNFLDGSILWSTSWQIQQSAKDEGLDG